MKMKKAKTIKKCVKSTQSKRKLHEIHKSNILKLKSQQMFTSEKHNAFTEEIHESTDA